jgi:hypothetical protein
MSTGDFDRDLALALEASAKEASASVTSVLIGTQREVSRQSLPAREDKHAPTKAKDGTIHQIGTLNQFHPIFQSLTAEFEGPSAICGFLSCAYAVLLENYLSDKVGDLDPTNIQEICDIVTDMDQVVPHLRRTFTEIQEARATQTTPATTPARRAALRLWVANYEIGDFLSRHATSDHTHFLRMNQWPARDAAEPALRARLAEEERFGGREINGGEVAYADGDSVYFFHSFRPEPVFHSPEEWASCRAAGAGRRPRALVLDLSGHYVAAIACHLRTARGAGADEGAPALLVLNTVDSDCLAAPAVAYAFDAAFPP